jgi:ribonuclease HI
VYTAHFDGSSLVCANVAGIAYIIKDPEGNIVSRFGKCIPPCDSNTAELKALVQLLIALIEIGVQEVEIYGDDKSVINQILYSKKIVTKRTQHVHRYFNYELVKNARGLLKKIPVWSLTWIPREKNHEADILSRVFIAPGLGRPRALHSGT